MLNAYGFIHCRHKLLHFTQCTFTCLCHQLIWLLISYFQHFSLFPLGTASHVHSQCKSVEDNGISDAFWLCMDLIYWCGKVSINKNTFAGKCDLIR